MFVILLRFLKNSLFSISLPVQGYLRGWPVVFAYPTLKGWRMIMNGKSLPINTTNISSLEYYRYYSPKEGDVVYDVGGELGMETSQFSILVGDSGHVITFECLPSHVQNLLKISKTKQNIKIVDAACWNKRQKLTFYIGATQGSSTAVADVRGQVQQKLINEDLMPIEVEADTLDSLYSQNTPGLTINYLKMDIEGAEIEALDGAVDMLKNVNYITVAAYHIRDGTPTAEAVLKKLRECNFDCFIDDNLHVYGKRKNQLIASV